MVAKLMTDALNQNGQELASTAWLLIQPNMNKIAKYNAETGFSLICEREDE
jgi:hypothetical protein